MIGKWKNSGFISYYKMGKKFPDRGNKRRFIKNVFRMIKNPLGYFYWKTYRFASYKGRIMYMGAFFTILTTFIKYKHYSNANQRKK